MVLLEAYIMTMCFSLQESNRRTEVGSELGKRKRIPDDRESRTKVDSSKLSTMPIPVSYSVPIILMYLLIAAYKETH